MSTTMLTTSPRDHKESHRSARGASAHDRAAKVTTVTPVLRGGAGSRCDRRREQR